MFVCEENRERVCWPRDGQWPMWAWTKNFIVSPSLPSLSLAFLFMPHKPIKPSMTLLEDELAQEERALVRSIEELFLFSRRVQEELGCDRSSVFLRGLCTCLPHTSNLVFFFLIASRAGMVPDDTG